MAATVTNLAVWRAKKQRQSEAREHVVRMYKGEIMDWCGHDLACAIVSEKLHISERTVRHVIADAGVIW